MKSIAFADSETRSPLDLPKVGGYKYAHHPETDVLVWSYAIGDEPATVWSPPWAYDAENDSIYELYEHIRQGGYFVAWNAFFDRWIWNSVMVNKYDAPYLPLEQVLCAQAQAEGNNLPGALGKAAECLGTYHKKNKSGTRLITALCGGTRADWTAQDTKMGNFRAYALHDVLSMRDIWNHTRALTKGEWDEYHASERINDRGVGVDAEFAAAAMQYAVDEFDDLNNRLLAVTGDPKITITNHVLKAAWLYDQLYPCEELREVVTKPPKRKDGPIRKTCDRATREAVLEMLNVPEYGDVFREDHREKIIEFLETIEAGNSAAVRKFTAIVNQENAGRVHGQYSFNGAGQTGRFSSRGIQIHNLIRDSVDKTNPDRALDAIDAILSGARPDDLVSEFGYSISRLLARLVRPTFVAPDGRILVWADYDQVEGRCLPWLANSPQADTKLNLYREGIDTYKVAAKGIYALSKAADATPAQRQVGKVAELALGFGGASGAFKAMSKGYGLVIDEADADKIVTAWRIENQWAVNFWHELWGAAIAAYGDAGRWHHAGRVAYYFHPALMHGTLICRLPNGRWLTYPQFKREWVEWLDENGREHRKRRTSYVKGFSNGGARVDLWYGVLAENITQATAADILRGAILKLDHEECVVLHTHDEIVCEVPERMRDAAAEQLEHAMTWLPDWAEGLPLSVSVESGPYYTK